MKRILCSLLAGASMLMLHAQKIDTITFDSTEIAALIQQVHLNDSIENSFQYEFGSITLGEDLATITVPEGYKFLNAKQANYVLTDLWGNPPSDVLGLLLPSYTTPLSDSLMYAVEISFSEDGYIEDEDAKDLDYDDLLETMQNDIREENPIREENGYEPAELVGWASPPYYDATTRKLHWAKEIKFGTSEIHTLNYNIRVLGRKGYLTLNAIGDMEVLPAFQQNIDPILASVEFNEGQQYGDFNPELDKVAAYGVGGLIAGKVLAKVGFFALILKFWKFIAIGALALFAGLRKRLFGGSSS